MFNAIKEFFSGKPAVSPTVEVANQAPYKVPEPTVIQDYADIAIAQLPDPRTPASVPPVVKKAVAEPVKAPAKMSAPKKKPDGHKPAGAKKAPAKRAPKK